MERAERCMDSHVQAFYGVNFTMEKIFSHGIARGNRDATMMEAGLYCSLGTHACPTIGRRKLRVALTYPMLLNPHL